MTEPVMRVGCQLSRGADLSLVTVGFSWTLAKGFLRREECRQFGTGALGKRTTQATRGLPAGTLTAFLRTRAEDKRVPGPGLGIPCKAC